MLKKREEEMRACILKRTPFIVRIISLLLVTTALSSLLGLYSCQAVNSLDELGIKIEQNVCKTEIEKGAMITLDIVIENSNTTTYTLEISLLHPGFRLIEDISSPIVLKGSCIYMQSCVLEAIETGEYQLMDTILVSVGGENASHLIGHETYSIADFKIGSPGLGWSKDFQDLLLVLASGSMGIMGGAIALLCNYHISKLKKQSEWIKQLVSTHVDQYEKLATVVRETMDTRAIQRVYKGVFKIFLPNGIIEKYNTMIDCLNSNALESNKKQVKNSFLLALQYFLLNPWKHTQPVSRFRKLYERIVKKGVKER